MVVRGSAWDAASCTSRSGTPASRPAAVLREEHRSLAALANHEVDGACGARGERDGNDLASLAGDHQGAVPALDARRLDICAGGLRHAQPVEGQQRDQRVLGGRAEAGGDEQGAELVSVQGSGMRLVVQPRPAHMHGWEWSSSSSSTAYR